MTQTTRVVIPDNNAMVAEEVDMHLRGVTGSLFMIADECRTTADQVREEVDSMSDHLEWGITRDVTIARPSNHGIDFVHYEGLTPEAVREHAARHVRAHARIKAGRIAVTALAGAVEGLLREISDYGGSRRNPNALMRSVAEAVTDVNRLEGATGEVVHDFLARAEPSARVRHERRPSQGDQSP